MRTLYGMGFLVLSIVLLCFGTMTSAQGDRCTPEGGKIVAAEWDHCAEVRKGVVHMWYTFTATDLQACVEGKTNGWVGLGFGGNGSDYVIGWNPGGAGQTVGDYKGHTSVNKDGKQDHTALAGKAVGEANGWTTFCFQRQLDTGDGDDTKIDVNTFLNFPWAIKGGDPADANNLDNQQHGSDGTASFKLSDPTEVPQGGGNGDGADEGGEGAGGNQTVLIAAGCVAGVLVLAGVGYMVKQNNAQVIAYGGSMGGSGGWGHGGYSSGDSRSRGGHSHSSKRSQSSKRSRSSSGKRSQASHRSRSKGHRH